MKLASFDIEISGDLSSPGDPNWPPRISCAAFAFSDAEEVVYFQSSPDSDSMTPDQVQQMAVYMDSLVRAGYIFVTWNGVAFDFQVVVANIESELWKAFVYQMAWNFHIDMMLLVTFQTGYRLGLDAALAGAGLAGKLHHVTLSDGTELTDMSGAKAPELWRAGERKAVLDYLREDVLQPLKLADHIATRRVIYWTSKKGRPMAIGVPGLYTVEESYRLLPEPGDLSWMSEPIIREDYIRKFLPNAALREGK